MELVNDNPADLAGVSGEMITIDVKATGTDRLVKSSLDGVALHESFFRLGATGSARLLTLAFAFNSADGNGRYLATLTGSAGGDVSKLIVNEPANAPKLETASYTITVK